MKSFFPLVPLVPYLFFTNGSVDLLPKPTNLVAGTTSSPNDLTMVSSNALDWHADSSTTPLECEISTPRRSIQVTTLHTHLRDYHCYYAIDTLHEPHSFNETCNDHFWHKVMFEELTVFTKTYTWDLVDLPLGKSTVGCKWIYKIKIKFDGFIEIYKACLVAKGFNQEYDINYEDAFAPVT